MSDIVVLQSQITILEKNHESLKDDVRELSDTTARIEDRVRDVEHWQDGNGAKGAEARLQAVEDYMTEVKACVTKAMAPDAIMAIAREAAKAVVTNARDKDRTAISKVRAFAPYFAGLCALVGTIIMALWK